MGEIRVLCVDDDKAFAEVVAASLEHHSPAVSSETAHSVEAALEYLERDHVDCIVSDYDMPETDGIEFLETLRSAGMDIPFVLYTAKGSENVAGRAISAGVTDYLQKRDGPQQFSVLARRVENAVETYRSRRALEESEERFRAMVEASRDVIVVYRDDRFLYVNDRTSEVTGYSREELLDGSFWSLIHPDDRARLQRRAAARLRGEDVSMEFEARIITAEGAVREMEFAAQTITVDGEPAGFVAGRDVTDARRRQRELEAQNRRLEEFAGIVSHDLRSPLTVASGGLELARRTGEDDQFDRVQRALGRMETLIDEMLTLSQHGSPAEETEPVSIEEVARFVWDELRTPGATLEVDAPGKVDSTRDAVRQLLSNLVGNALEHGVGDGASGANDGELTVRIGSLPGGGFYVEDDGQGIPPEERDRVFDRGFTTDTDGVGWGLVVVTHIATAHGWEVRVTESRAGGARFEVHTDAHGDERSPDGERSVV